MGEEGYKKREKRYWVSTKKFRKIFLKRSRRKFSGQIYIEFCNIFGQSIERQENLGNYKISSVTDMQVGAA